MKSYLLAKAVWDSLSLKARQPLLQQHGRHQYLSSRSYPYLPKEARADIQSDLLKQVPPQQQAKRQPMPHWQDQY